MTTYTYKGRTYQIINEEILMKHPTTRQWVTAVQYVSASGQQFIREKQDFQEKFTKVEEEQEEWTFELPEEKHEIKENLNTEQV